jgi:hypothetical protein
MIDSFDDSKNAYKGLGKEIGRPFDKALPSLVQALVYTIDYLFSNND